MPRLHKIYFLLAFIHLVMVGLFASHFAEWGKQQSAVTKTLSTAGDYSGSNNIFSFFAPALSDQPYVVYNIKDSLQKEHVIDIKGSSPDFTNRVNNIYGYLTLPEARSVFSASLAQYVLNRYPAADKIRVAMVVQKIPTMQQYLKGERCQWKFWFNRDFQRDSAYLAAK